MCLPAAPLIAIGLAAATTAVSVIAQNQQTSAMNKAIKEQYQAKTKEIDQQATSEINQRLREARREQGRILVAAGEAGLNTSSPVVEGLLNDAAMQAGQANSISLANRESRREAARQEANSMMQPKTTALGAGLQIALAGAKAGLPYTKIGKSGGG